MKSIALLLITLSAFAAIYFWVYFDRKSLAVSPGARLRQWLESLLAKTAAGSGLPAFSTPDVPNEGANLNFQSDLESEKVCDAKIVEAGTADPDDEPGEPFESAEPPVSDVDRSANKRLQLEKLKELMDKAKSVPVPPPSRKRASRSQTRVDGRLGTVDDVRIRSKLHTIERAIKARRGDCFLEAIPEALQSRDSFTN